MRRMGGDLTYLHTGTRDEFTLALVVARSPRRDKSITGVSQVDQEVA